MAEITRETTTVREDGNGTNTAAPAPEEGKASGSQTIAYVIYFLLGVLEILLVLRFILKLAGAGTSSGFVNFIYGVTGVFVLPFEGIFREWFNQGAETTSVFEPATLTAIIVYALVAWGIVSLIRIISGKKPAAE
jgi:hypothetical protein